MGVDFRGADVRVAQHGLHRAQVGAAFGAVLAGAWTPVQIGAFAAALRMQGESAETIVAAAHALRSVMTSVDHAHLEVVEQGCFVVGT